MPYSVITDSATEPVTLNEVKSFMRVTFSDEDTLINSIIKAARKFCEIFTNSAFINKTISAVAPDFQQFVEVPVGPLNSLSGITYIPENQTTYTLLYPFQAHILDVTKEIWPGQIRFRDSFTFPKVNTDRPSAVIYQYVAGYGPNASDVPDPIKQAMYYICQHFYDKRSLTMERDQKEIPFAVSSLLTPYKIYKV